MSATSISFNSYNLQTSNIITERILHTSSPENDFLSERKMRREGSYLLSNYWIRKIITVSGHIIGTSASDLGSRIDTLKQNLIGEKLDLDIGFAGGTRRYKATARRVEIEKEHFHSNWCPFSIEFACVDSFGRATSSTSETLSAQTTSPFNKIFTMGGSIGAYPIITLDFTSGSSVTVVKIENTATEEFMTVTRTFADAESLAIDCENLTVTVDSVDVDFTGVFPSFIVGSNNVEITVTGAFNIDLDITYTKIYI